MLQSDLLLVLKSSVLGEGEPDLGEKLIEAFLAQFVELDAIPARVICMGTGIFLTTTEGSPALSIMKRFEQAGTEIFTCGTCLEYYGRRDQLQVGSIGNMADTVRAMLEFRRVVQP